MSDRLPAGSIQVSDADLADLEARWAAAWSPAEVAARLAGVSAPWYVAAGWALDLFRGARSRPHGDIEIGVPASRFPEVRERFPDLAADAVGDRRIWRSATPEALAATHQTWLRDRQTDLYRLDVFREPHDGPTWVCRRDPTIRLPYQDIIRPNAEGIPYLIPELVLLFKAKAVRPKDQADFEGVLPLLDGKQRQRLRSLLTRVHPGHSWLTEL